MDQSVGQPIRLIHQWTRSCVWTRTRSPLPYECRLWVIPGITYPTLTPGRCPPNLKLDQATRAPMTPYLMTTTIGRMIPIYHQARYLAHRRFLLRLIINQANWNTRAQIDTRRMTMCRQTAIYGLITARNDPHTSRSLQQQIQPC